MWGMGYVSAQRSQGGVWGYVGMCSMLAGGGVSQTEGYLKPKNYKWYTRVEELELEVSVGCEW